MDDPFHYSEQLQQILCSDCFIAVLPPSLAAHLSAAKPHQHLQAIERRDIERQWFSRQPIISFAEQVAKQRDSREEIVGLRSVEGYCCLQCNHGTINNKSARIHQLQSQPRLVSTIAGRPRYSPGQTRDWSRAWIQSVFAPRSEHYHRFIIQRAVNIAGERSSKQSGERSGERSGKRSGKRWSKQSGERSGKQSGERWSKQSSERSSQQSSERSGKRSSERPSKPSSERPSRKSGERSGK